MATGRLPDPNSAPVTAKGDLYTYSTVPAKLAVGNNGETLVADSSATTGLRYNPQNALVNPVINGGFDNWQRGTTFLNPNNGYTADRWVGSIATAGTITRQTTSDTTNLPNIQYALRYQRTAASSSVSNLSIATSFETVNSIPFAGKTVTFSFYARKGADYSAASNALVARLFTGTGTDQNVYTAGYTGSVTLIDQTVTLTTTWQRFAFTATIAAATTEIGIIFISTPVGTAGAADFYEVTGVQIDLGTYTASSAPTFRRSGGTLAGELAACQRYYWRMRTDTGSVNGWTNGVGYAFTTSLIVLSVQLPVPMRVAPTSVDYSGMRVINTGDAAVGSLTSIALNASTELWLNVLITKTSSFTTDKTYWLTKDNNINHYIGASAEL